jgi:hypothetical protein
MSDLNELFAELKAEIFSHYGDFRDYAERDCSEAILYKLDELINNGEFARAEQDAYIG